MILIFLNEFNVAMRATEWQLPKGLATGVCGDQVMVKSRDTHTRQVEINKRDSWMKDETVFLAKEQKKY